MNPEKSAFQDKTYRRLLLIASILLPVALLLHLGLAPLMLEEPRRGLVTMEMLAADNFWVPRLFGELYYNKPPVFNWLLMASAALWGELDEWALRLPTVFSLAGMGVLTFLAGRHYVSTIFGWIAGLLVVCSVDLLFYFSLLGEIDLFYSLISYGSILAVFYFYQKEKPYALFFTVYTLGAIGFLTKGLPSVLFAGLTIVAYLSYKRSWRLLLSAGHVMGILSFAVLVAAYFTVYAQYEDPRPFLGNLLTASANRSPLGESWVKIPQHLATFPLDTLKNLLPAAFLLVFGLRKESWRKLWQHPFLQFSVIAFAANYTIYWISPGSRQRYVYMLFPLAILALTYLYYQQPDFRPGRRLLRVIGLLGSAVVALAGITLPFLTPESLPTIPLAFGITLFTGSSLLFIFLFRRPALSLPAIIVVLVLSRILFDLTVLPQRNRQSAATREQQWAQQVAALTENAPLHLVKGHRSPFSFTFYLNQYRRRPLQTLAQYQVDSYYILDNQEPPGWKTLLDFGNQGQCYYLGVFTETPDPVLFNEREQEQAVLRE